MYFSTHFVRSKKNIIVRACRELLLIVLFFLLGSTPIFADHLPKPTNYINDFAEALTSEQESDLNNQLYNFEQDTQNQIAVAIVRSLKDEPIEDFAVKAFEEWKIGNQEKDNGVLVVISVDDRKVRIEVGYGAEGFLTDGEAGEIIRNVITPQFKEENYYQGLKNGLSSIQTQLSDQSAVVEKSREDPTQGILKFIWSLFVGTNFFILLPIVYFIAYMSRTKSIWAGGVAGGVVGLIIGLILTSLLVGLIASGILGVLGLLLDYLLSRTYQQRKDAGKATDWWHSGGGFWYGGNKSSGGFGGFGGGSSGGGGASGKW